MHRHRPSNTALMITVLSPDTFLQTFSKYWKTFLKRKTYFCIEHKRPYMKRLFLSAVIMALTFWSALSKEQYIYTQISQKYGLSATVNSIFKEKQGEVWIGTPSGLFRFNGSTLHNVDNELIKGRRIMQTTIDNEGCHWILTDMGLVRHDPENDTYHEMKLPDTDDPTAFHSCCNDPDGICFGSLGKIYRYEYGSRKMRLLCNIGSQPSFICRNMSLLDERTVICTSLNGIILIDIVTGEISELPALNRTSAAYSMVDSKGRIWLTPYNQGIKVFGKDGSLLNEFNTANSKLSNDIVLCMTERDSMIWAGTDGGGINIIDMETGMIEVMSQIPGDRSSFPTHSIKSIYTDNDGNIWAGSVRDGLIRISWSGMKTYGDSHIGTSTGLSNSTVLCLYQKEGDDGIWIGTDGEGINRFNPETGKFTHYESTLGCKVTSIAEYSETELIISAYSDRIWIFDTITGKKKPLDIDDERLNFQLRYAGRGINLHNEVNGSILIIGNEIRRYDKKTGDCRIIASEDGMVAKGNYMPIGVDGEDFILHDDKNIYILRNGSGSMEEISGTGSAVIRSGSIDRNGAIWLGTDSGLYRLDPDTKDMVKIPTSLFTNVNSVICDNLSRVWVGTDRHLYVYLADSGNFAMLGDSDGASTNEYLPKPRLMTESGDIYIGGVLGLLRIDSSFGIDNYEEPVVSLYRLTVDGNAVNVLNGSMFKLSRKNRALEISVSVHETDIFREKMYRFHLSDDNEDIITESSTLSLQPLPKAGVYDIMVSCSKRNGKWSTPVKVLTLKIPQPFYLTWWFLGGCLALITGIVASLLIGSTRKKRNMMILAEKEQEQRIYEEKVRMLINISHELRTPLTLIMAPLKRLISNADPADGQTPVLNRIYRQSRRMRDLLNMVLDLRKMEVGRSTLKIESVRLNDWLTNAVSDIRSEEMETGISIELDLDDRIGEVELDRQKCDTVVTNILMNAIKHSIPGNTITISTKLTEDEMARVSISDQGAGLDEADASGLFTRFYQNNQETYGSGIGLSYSKILVELHGGRISAENNEDRGATFWWEIPVRTEKDKGCGIVAKPYLNELLGHDTSGEAPSSEEGRITTSGLSLMLVDDSQDLLDFLKEAMSPDFADIMLATGGNQAYRMLESGTVPDVIVSDINMPDGDGFKLCRDIKSNGKFSHIPVVLLTARGEEQSQSDSYRLGADGFIAKPFETETLLELIRSIFRRKAEIRKRYLDFETTEEYGSDEEGFVIRFNRVIEEHIGNPELDQNLLCRELGMSRAALYSKLKATTGTGAKEYITRIRIEKAKTLMEKTSLSMTEISEMTGFSAPGYFSTAFKNYTGLTPSQYRKENGGRQDKNS